MEIRPPRIALSRPQATSRQTRLQPDRRRQDRGPRHRHSPQAFCPIWPVAAQRCDGGTIRAYMAEDSLEQVRRERDLYLRLLEIGHHDDLPPLFEDALDLIVAALCSSTRSASCPSSPRGPRAARSGGRAPAARAGEPAAARRRGRRTAARGSPTAKRASSRSTAERSAFGRRCRYRAVVAMSAWPRSFWTTRTSDPLVRSAVAYPCRRACGHGPGSRRAWLPTSRPIRARLLQRTGPGLFRADEPEHGDRSAPPMGPDKVPDPRGQAEPYPSGNTPDKRGRSRRPDPRGRSTPCSKLWPAGHTCCSLRRPHTSSPARTR